MRCHLRCKLILSFLFICLEFVTRCMCYFPTTNKAYINSVVDTASRHQEDSKLFLLDHYEEQDNSAHNCQVSAKCYRLNSTSCLGIKLPYSSTSFSLVPGVRNHEEVQDKLQQWKGLIHIPKCWAAIQPFLCSLYMPKCENNLVDLPSMEMCEMIQSPCRILNVRKLWPSEFICNSSLLHYNCKNEVRELKFNSTGQCKEPLVHTDQESSYYNGIEGCGVQCHDPLFTVDERQEIKSIVIWGSSIAFICNLFTVLTFAIDWNSSSKYPVHAIFYLNMSFLMVSIGFLYQFRPGAGDYTVCHKDGTLRTSEPSVRENLSCVTSFVFTYYFLIAGIVWFVIFSYSWQLSTQAVGKIKKRMDRKGPYYHLVAWSLPLVLTITVMALGEVDGDSLTGVCFVGVINKQMRGLFLLVPLAASLFVGLFFFTRGLVSLILLKLSRKDVIISDHGNACIRENIVRVTVFSVLSLLFAVVTYVCHIYDFLHHVSWKESFRDFLVCQLRVGKDVDVEKCIMHSRPSVLMVQLQLLALFSTHVNMSTWIWSSVTVNKWSRFIVSKVMNKEIDEPVMLKRHKLIARAFAKRKLLNTDGRLSISICNTRQDPIGLHFELNSQASNDISTTWAKALPKLITRRNALIVAPGSNSSQRRNSVDSEISYSVRRVSVESRRHSLDSTVSVQAVEVTKTVRKRPHRKKNRPQKCNKYKRRWSSKYKYDKDSESLSQDSNLETEILAALKIGSINIQQTVPNMKRRSAISGNEKDSLLVLHGKLFESVNNRCSSSTSDSYDNRTPMIQPVQDIELGIIQQRTDSCTDDEHGESADDDIDDDDSYPLSSLLSNNGKMEREDIHHAPL